MYNPKITIKKKLNKLFFLILSNKELEFESV